MIRPAPTGGIADDRHRYLSQMARLQCAPRHRGSTLQLSSRVTRPPGPARTEPGLQCGRQVDGLEVAVEEHWGRGTVLHEPVLLLDQLWCVEGATLGVDRDQDGGLAG